MSFGKGYRSTVPGGIHHDDLCGVYVKDSVIVTMQTYKFHVSFLQVSQSRKICFPTMTAKESCAAHVRAVPGRLSLLRLALSFLLFQLFQNCLCMLFEFFIAFTHGTISVMPIVVGVTDCAGVTVPKTVATAIVITMLFHASSSLPDSHFNSAVTCTEALQCSHRNQ